MIQSLQSNYPKSLRHVQISEIDRQCFLGGNKDPIQLNQKLFNALCHSQTLSLKITNFDKSVITSQMINDMLEKCENLTSFFFNGFLSTNPLEIDLSKCLHLKKIKLIGIINKISAEVIQSLKHCRNLTELSIDDISINPRVINEFLCSDHGLNLEVLNLESEYFLNDDETLDLATRKLKNLRFFDRVKLFSFGCNVTNHGLVQLAINCNKLNTLIFDFQNITDEGLKDFTKNAPNLTTLSIYGMNNLTEKGIKALSKSCRNLENLQLIGYEMKITPGILKTLAKNCKRLRILDMRYVKFVDTTAEDLKQFTVDCKSLNILSIAEDWRGAVITT